jgi:colanic acid/amylovoran biosynthesis glycosyltransferase
VVSTLSGGIPEAVKHGETGLLVSECNPAALAESILALIQDDELWHRYSVAGRIRVVDHFNLQHQTERLENVFEQLVGDR